MWNVIKIVVGILLLCSPPFGWIALALYFYFTRNSHQKQVEKTLKEYSALNKADRKAMKAEFIIDCVKEGVTDEERDWWLDAFNELDELGAYNV